VGVEVLGHHGVFDRGLAGTLVDLVLVPDSTDALVHVEVLSIEIIQHQRLLPKQREILTTRALMPLISSPRLQLLRVIYVETRDRSVMGWRVRSSPGAIFLSFLVLILGSNLVKLSGVEVFLKLVHVVLT
jgi:hypothetical protein